MDNFFDDLPLWADQPSRPLRPKLVLLDDDETMHGWVRSVFRSTFDIAWTPEKAQFLEAVTQIPLIHPPDVVITDVNSPGMSGLRFVHEWRFQELYRKFPVVVMTGYRGYRSKLGRFGVSGFVGKPCRVREILGTVGWAHYRHSGQVLPLMNLLHKGRARARSKPKLTLVDENPGPTTTYRKVFESQYGVTVSPSKTEFIESVRRSPKDAPDVVIASHGKYPISGLEMLERMWNQGMLESVPVILASPFDLRGMAVEYGATDFLQLPFTIKGIRDTVARAYFRVGPWGV